ncbi:MAG: mechanosensitive ion channel [bacterium]|nr:mechanosensitive ion channel [bacterium]
MSINWEALSRVSVELAVRIPIIFLLILGFLLVRRILTRVIMRPLIRLLSRGSAAPETVEIGLSRVIQVPLNYVMVALVLDSIARLYDIQPPLVSFIFSATRTLVIAAVLIFCIRLTDLITRSRGGLFRFTGLLIEESLIPFARTALQLVMAAIAVAIVIQIWGYDVSGLIAGLGIGGLAISLAAQDTLSNLFGFTALVSDRPFLVGEYIKTPDVEGVVEHVGLRSTRVRQLDQALVSIPNSKLAASAVLNWSRLSKRWLNMTLGLHYQTSADQVETLLAHIRDILEGHEQVDSSTILVNLVSLSSQSMEVLVRAYFTIPDWNAFTAEKQIVLLKVLRALETLDIQLAIPLQEAGYPHLRAPGGRPAEARPAAPRSS